MKHWLLAAALICFGSQAQASPYFRILGYNAKPRPVAGALLDPRDLGNSEATSLVPVFPHSPKDGCLFPSLICEDWTPLAVGVSMNAGKVTFDAGPIANILPWVQRGALALTPDSWSGIRSVLAPNPDAPVTFSAGPIWQYRQANDKGYLKVFTGLALNFN